MTTTLQRLWRIESVLYAALVVAPFFLLVVASQVVARPSVAPADATVEMLGYVLAGVAAVEMVAMLIVRRRLLPPRREGAPLADEHPVVQSPGSAAVRYLSVQIMTWALCESIAILGLVLTIVGQSLRYVVLFGVVSLANFVVYRPRREELECVIRAAGDSGDKRE